MIKEKLKSFSDLFENYLKEVITTQNKKFIGHFEAMEYSLLSGGKRLRPFILKAFYSASGGENGAFLNFAAALEMIHTYSLIHDDLPSMDNDDFRRGRPSCHKAFDEATALLAGDALLTKAFEVAALTKNISPSLIVEGIAELASLAGADGMIGGQVVDLAIENQRAPIETVLEMYKKKTAALLVAAAKIGTILAGGNDEMKLAAEKYAVNLGIAFQIQDDILDVVGDANLLGKPIGSDAKNQKSTYVALKGLEQAKLDVIDYTNKAKNALKVFGVKADVLLELADYLIDRKY
ncbi:MAG: polyprenyl synthetase family protein [Clostridia bacterium]|nr:polyprenyl synthetase family protein [Clostridia bacterium]